MSANVVNDRCIDFQCGYPQCCDGNNYWRSTVVPVAVLFDQRMHAGLLFDGPQLPTASILATQRHTAAVRAEHSCIRQQHVLRTETGGNNTCYAQRIKTSAALVWPANFLNIRILGKVIVIRAGGPILSMAHLLGGISCRLIGVCVSHCDWSGGTCGYDCQLCAARRSQLRRRRPQLITIASVMTCLRAGPSSTWRWVGFVQRALCQAPAEGQWAPVVTDGADSIELGRTGAVMEVVARPQLSSWTWVWPCRAAY